MAEKIKYLLRLKLRVTTGKPLATEESTLTVSIADTTVTIKSDINSCALGHNACLHGYTTRYYRLSRLLLAHPEPLSKASWLVFQSRGFETEDDAREFGERLRRAVHLVGLCAKVGVDAGDPGEDRTLSWVNPEILRNGGLDANTRIGPDVHGIVVVPDDEKNLFVRMGPASVEVRSNADDFVHALVEALPERDVSGSDFPSIRRAIRLLNLAEINSDPIAKMVLAISTVENLAIDPPWTDFQQKLIECSAAWLKRTHGNGEETSQVIEAILQIRKESIRKRIRKLLSVNELSDMWQDWDKLYSKRSRLFHGRTKNGSEHLGNHLEETEVHVLGQEAIKLCARIVLTMAKREGISVPDRAKVHFCVE